MAGLFVGQTDVCEFRPALDNSSEKSDETQSKEEGGWPFEFVDVIEKELECPICLLPLKNPWLTDCGHNLCRNCLDKLLLRENAFCPEDRNPISKENIFRDMRVHRKVMCLKVKCPYAEMEPYACKWIGELNDLKKKHLDFCELEEVACTRENCNETLTRKTFQSHLDDRCLWRKRDCYYCLKPIVVCMLKNHEDVDCMEITVACSNTCGQQMSKKELNFHLENSCQNRRVSCPFEDCGCKEKFAAGDIEKHINDNIGRHLLVMCNKTKDQGQEIQILKESNKDLERGVKILTDELNESRREIEMLNERNIDQDKEVKLLTEQLDGARREIEMLKNTLSVEIEIQELQLRLDQFHQADISAFLTFISKNENKNILGKVNNFLKAESIYDCHFMDNAWSYRKDDQTVFIWFVNNFKLHQHQQKKSDPFNVVCSPDFRTGKKGYFVNAHLFAHESGESKGSDLYCALLNGKDSQYDNEIKFPHDQLFSVTVINFKDRTDDVSVETTFQMTAVKFQKDVGEWCKILDVRRVNNFLINGTIVLKISVNHYSA